MSIYFLDFFNSKQSVENTDKYPGRDEGLASERIKREIEAIAKISHQNILKILDSDRDDQWYVS